MLLNYLRQSETYMSSVLKPSVGLWIKNADSHVLNSTQPFTFMILWRNFRTEASQAIVLASLLESWNASTHALRSKKSIRILIILQEISCISFFSQEVKQCTVISSFTDQTILEKIITSEGPTHVLAKKSISKAKSSKGNSTDFSLDVLKLRTNIDQVAKVHQEMAKLLQFFDPREHPHLIPASSRPAPQVLFPNCCRPTKSETWMANQKNLRGLAQQ